MPADAKVALGVGAVVIVMLLLLALYGYMGGAWNMPLPP
jgi:hypothetical protein